MLELAPREALSLGHNAVGTGHVLLGLVREPDAGSRLLAGFDAGPQRVGAAVLEPPTSRSPEAAADRLGRRDRPHAGGLAGRLERIEHLLGEIAGRLKSIERKLERGG